MNDICCYENILLDNGRQDQNLLKLFETRSFLTRVSVNKVNEETMTRRRMKNLDLLPLCFLLLIKSGG